MSDGHLARGLRSIVSFRAMILALSAPVAALPLCAAQAGSALPTSGHYVAGAGTIAKKGSNGLSVNQTSNTGIINWSSFSVGKGDTVRFNNGSGATLNRVTGANLSTIAGRLTATGSLYLINPQGVIVSGSGRVVTGGSFTASSRDETDSDFLNGKRKFAGTSRGNVSNAGRIVSSGGDVALIGHAVTNTGSLSAASGTASMSAANHVLLAPEGSRILVSGGTGDARNSGTVEGAQAQIKAAGGNVYALAGNNGGIVRATGRSTINGHVWLTSGTRNVKISGRVLAGGAGGSSGVVNVSADSLAVTETGTIKTAGKDGGTINLIGAAKATVAGNVDAGGRKGGGRIETSGGKLKILGTVSAGKKGRWLLDPVDLTIDAAAATSISTALNSGSSVTVKTGAATSSSGGHGGITGSGNGDISIESPITWSGQNATLTLDAYNDIDIDATILDLGSTGGVTLVYGDTAENGSHAMGMGSLNFGGAGNVAFSGYASNATPLSINGQAYKIENTIADLSSAISGNSSGFYALAHNIDASGTTYTSAPITTIFDGTLEGAGNTIDGLKIHSTAVGANKVVGMFVESDGAISDLHLTNIDVTSVANTGMNLTYVGSLVGYGSGTIANVTVSGSVTGGTNNRVGGLISANYGTISHTTSSVNVTNAPGAETGGLAAMNSGGTMTDDIVTGNVTGTGDNNFIGGLAGYSTGTIVNSHMSGNITAGSGGTDIGGLVGSMDNGSIATSYVTGSVTGGTYVGGAVGYMSHGTISGSYASGDVTALSQFAGGLVGVLGGSIDGSHASGNVTGNNVLGGLVGDNSGTITGSHASGIVTGTASGSDAASPAMFGGLVGENQGSVSSSYATGQVVAGTAIFPLSYVAAGGLVGLNTFTGATVDSSWSTAAITVRADNAQIGGLVGVSSQPITNSWAGGAITLIGANGQLGGLVGANTGAIQYNYAIGNISATGTGNELGGLVGDDSGTIDNTYASGSLNGTGSGTKVGGLVGNEATLTNITNSYFDTATTGFTSGIGGGMNTAGAVAISSQSGTNNSFAQSSYTHFSFGSHWVMFDGDTRPMLVAEETSNITNGHQLQLISADPTADYTLADEIDLTGDTNASDIWNTDTGFLPIGDVSTAFTGTFDGQTHSITGLNINRPTTEFVGLFGIVDGGGTIANVTLKNSGIDQVIGLSDVGALIGYIHGGAVTNAGSFVAVSGKGNIGGLIGTSSADVSNSYAAAPVDGGGLATQVGGLIGESSGSITNSYASGFVLHGGDDSGGLVGTNHSGVITGSYATGQVRGQNSTGGLVGLNEAGGTIADSYAMGNVVGNNNTGGLVGFMNGGSVFTSYSLGMVSGSAAVGGLVGNLGSGDFTNVYWDTETSGFGVHNAVGNVVDETGITGKTTAQLQSALQTGFSSDTWSVDAATPGTAFAYLKWQYPSGFAPQTLSGTVLTGFNGSPIQNAHIKILDNGAGFGEQYTYANGYYYMADAPVGSNDEVLAYITGGSRGNVLVEGNQLGPDATEPGSLTGVDIYAGWVNEITREADYNAVTTDLITAAGGTNSDYLFDSGTGALNGGINLRLESKGTTFSIDSDIDLAGLTFVLDSDHTVTQSNALTAQNVLLTGNGSLKLTNAGNTIGALAANGQMSLSVSSDSIDVGTVEGFSGIAAGGDVTLTSTSGNIALDQNLTTASGTVRLASAGTVAETGAARISAATLAGSSHGSVALNGANLITNLSAFSTGANNAFSLTDAHDLTVAGAVNAGTAGLTLTTTGAGHDILLDKALTGGLVRLASAATISESTGGKITAATLAGSSVGAVLLNAANVITNLAAFSTGGNNAFALTDAHDLTVTGAVNSGTGALTLTTTGAGNDLLIDKTLHGGVVRLVSAATIGSNSDGKITATTLAGSSVGAVALNAANVITNLAAFSTGGNYGLSLTDASDLTVSGAVNAGTGTLALTTTGTGHDILVNKTLKGGLVKLTSAATIAANADGKITATTLSGSSAGAVLLTAANVITNLAAFSTGGNNAFSLTDAHDLAVTGAVNAGTGALVLRTTGSGSDLVINKSLKGGAITLASAGTVTEDASHGAITATTLAGSSVGGTSLGGANLIATLSNFKNTGAGNIALKNGKALTVSGAVSVASATGTLALTATTGNLTINGSLSGATDTLVSAGEILEGSSGAVTATKLLNVTAKTGIKLDSSHNHIAKVGTRKTNSGPNIINGIGM